MPGSFAVTSSPLVTTNDTTVTQAEPVGRARDADACGRVQHDDPAQPRAAQPTGRRLRLPRARPNAFQPSFVTYSSNEPSAYSTRTRSGSRKLIIDSCPISKQTRRDRLGFPRTHAVQRSHTQQRDTDDADRRDVDRTVDGAPMCTEVRNRRLRYPPNYGAPVTLSRFSGRYSGAAAGKTPQSFA